MVDPHPLHMHELRWTVDPKRLSSHAFSLGGKIRDNGSVCTKESFDVILPLL